jgi:threonine/homoserine/homoserine lactone efflux protein
MLAYILQGLTLGFSAAGTPGGYQAFLLGQAVQRGLRRSWYLAFAPLISDGPVVAVILFALAQVPEAWLRLLRIVGGLFLLYLGWGAYGVFRRGPSQMPQAPASQSLLKAVIANLLSPGLYLFWSVIGGPIVLNAPQTTWAVGFAAGFYCTLIGASVGLMALFALARQLGPRAALWLNGFSAVALVGFGAYQIWGAFTGG